MPAWEWALNPVMACRRSWKHVRVESMCYVRLHACPYVRLPSELLSLRVRNPWFPTWWPSLRQHPGFPPFWKLFCTLVLVVFQYCSSLHTILFFPVVSLYSLNFALSSCIHLVHTQRILYISNFLYLGNKACRSAWRRIVWDLWTAEGNGDGCSA